MSNSGLDIADFALRDRLSSLDAELRSAKNGGDLRQVAATLCSISELLYSAGEYKRAAIKVKTAVAVLRRSSHNDLYAECKHLLGRILTYRGDFISAVEELTESYISFRRARVFSGMVRPLNSLAKLHFVTGNLRRSREVLNKALFYIDKYSLDSSVESIHRNLARISYLMGRFSEVENSIELGLLGDDSEARAKADLFMGIVQSHRLNLIDAKTRLEAALEFFEQYGHSLDRIVCLEYLGRNEYYRGNFRKAREYCRKILDMPEPTASASAQTLRMLTDVHIAEENWGLAATTAKQAEAAILKINERIELAALWRAYGQIFAHKGETDKSREHFRNSIDLLSEIGARFELAMTYYVAGTSEAYKCEERRHNLEVARLLFVEMDVPKRVEQMDEVLGSMAADPVPDVIEQDGAPTIIAKSKAMKEVIATADAVASSNLSVLLTGQTGTGKDLLAKYIHYKSGRSGEFVPLNAAALPQEMVEAELFGYRKGAFSDAKNDRKGLLETADGGTFYLNEIGDATLETQAKLLEAIENRRFRRLGENTLRNVDFRLIAATNHNVREKIGAGEFREDLFYRLDDVSIELPPLADRENDTIELVKHFVQNVFNGHADCDIKDLIRLGEIMSVVDFDGNVRQLRARVGSLYVRFDGDIEKMIENGKKETRLPQSELVRRILERNGNNQSLAARILGMSESKLRRIVKKFAL